MAYSVKKNEDACKYRLVYDALIREFSAGHCMIGKRVPSEREMASRLQVNIRTVRRAFRDLTLGGIVEKKVGSGTYLKHYPDSSWEKKPVNIILSSSYDPQVRRLVEQMLPAISEEKGHSFRLIDAAETELEKLLESCISLDQGTILGLPSLSGAEAVMKKPELFVMLSSQSYKKGIPCVQCDDTCGINLLMDHLHGLGHRRIAFLGLDEKSGDGLADLQAAVWGNLMGDNFDPDLKIRLTKNVGNSIRAACLAVRKQLRTTSFSAILCATDELMYGAMAAIREAGLSIPRDVSVISIGNTPLAEFAFPPVTSCDPCLAGHLRAAFELLDWNHAHPEKLETLRLIRPEIVYRKSTAKLHKTKEK